VREFGKGVPVIMIGPEKCDWVDAGAKHWRVSRVYVIQRVKRGRIEAITLPARVRFANR
jgi:hypothetical protein